MRGKDRLEWELRQYSPEGNVDVEVVGLDSLHQSNPQFISVTCLGVPGVCHMTSTLLRCSCCGSPVGFIFPLIGKSKRPATRKPSEFYLESESYVSE
jgi:hypothetical protein